MIVQEFITITGREVRSQEVFRRLKHRAELVQVFEQLSKYYEKNGGDHLTKVEKDYILKNISDRKAELAAYAVSNDLDVDMLKCLLAGG